MNVLYRQIEYVKGDKWKKKLALEKSIVSREMELGYPEPRLYRPLFGQEYAETTRVYERIFDSYLNFSSFLEAKLNDEELVALEKENEEIVTEARAELFYVDSLSPVPRWMSAVTRRPFTKEELEHPLDFYPIERPDEEEKKENIEKGKLRILYRLIQKVPKDRWAEKFEQERISDIAERSAGSALPIRYRSMFASELSQLRINEREYESFEDFAALTESFFAMKRDSDKACMEQEVRRQDFFEWEREEVYIVDSDSFTPLWMEN